MFEWLIESKVWEWFFSGAGLVLLGWLLMRSRRTQKDGSKEMGRQTDIKDSPLDIVGDNTKVEGDIHIHPPESTAPPEKSHSERDRPPWFMPLIVFFCIVMTSLLLTIILCDRSFAAITETRANWQIILSMLGPPLICIAFILALSKAYRNISMRLILFFLIPLCTVTSSLVSAALLLDVPVRDIIPAVLRDERDPSEPACFPVTTTTSSTTTTRPASVLPDTKADPPVPDERKADPVEPASNQTGKQEHLPKENQGSLTKPLPRPSGEVDLSNSIGMDFVYIPPGSFMMGSPEDEPGRFSRETQHWVTLTQGFYMQTTEVTQGQWRAVMGSDPPELYFKNCGDDCPVERVSWNDAQEFISKLNKLEKTDKYRLPTEAEWEYACRAGTTTPFYFGRCLSTDQANYYGSNPLKGCPKGEYRGKTIPVASLEPNKWGLYDMHGNVWEWCQDWYGNYPSRDVADPVGSRDGSLRVLRGGSWDDFAWVCRSAYRVIDSPGDRDRNEGLRLVCFIGQQVGSQAGKSRQDR